MKLYDFNKLDINQRADNLWWDGDFILNFKEELYSFNLYTFCGYFVEATEQCYVNFSENVMLTKDEANKITIVMLPTKSGIVVA
jgi:hypothetical protein